MAQNPSETPQNEPAPPTPVGPPQNIQPAQTSPTPPVMPPPVPPLPPEYPANVTVDYPDRPLNRLTTFFRIWVAIPIWIIYILLTSGYGTHYTPPAASGQSTTIQNTIGGIAVLFLPVLLMLLFRKKYPKWWYDWNYEFTKFSLRLCSYLLLLRDEYPSTDEEQAVHVYLPYPDAKLLSRGLPLVKWFLAIPHYIILFMLGIAALVIVIIAWFAILFTGRYPSGMFDFVVGVLRWALRVEAYAFLLTTDRYPPFSLS